MNLTSPAKRKSGRASSTTGTVVVELAPSLWQQLPPDLCEKILSKLPLSALRKFSRVSKRWKALFRSVEFAREYEGISGYHVVADGGLLCYRIWNKRGLDPWITLVVQNPLTRKWRRLIVPHPLEPDFPTQKMMWGLMLDQENGSYKVVVALCDPYLPRKAFIYDSVSSSWSISAALAPALVSDFDNDEWEVRSVLCSSGELLWLLEEMDEDILSDNVSYKWFIKYNFELDEWSTVTHELPLDVEGKVYLVHHEVKNRPMMVNFDLNYENVPSSARFPSEFLELDPNLGKVGIEDIDRLANEAGNTELADIVPKLVAFGGGTWYILPDTIFYKDGLDVFAVSENPPTVTRLPKINDQFIVMCGTFAATLKAFL
ncbi:hypothetical protein R1sor_004876 [Riccia sorocarpa]|uniref:F-box domain-containing protein n=1 Tax=Riccia sorocarpa TaxID=122646 RepID=A0ABD3HLR4_9MARC